MCHMHAAGAPWGHVFSGAGVVGRQHAGEHIGAPPLGIFGSISSVRAAIGAMVAKVKISKEADVPYLCGVLETYLTSKGTRDLAMIMQPLMEQVTWKTAPKAGLMAQFADVAELICRRATLAGGGVFRKVRACSELVAKGDCPLEYLSESCRNCQPEVY